MSKKELTKTEDNYDLLLADLVEIVETSQNLANKVICSSINEVFAENGIELNISGELATNPLALKILGLKNEYSGKTAKEIILLKIEEFLVNFELNFTVVHRKKVFKIGETSYRVDLVLYHRRLRCLVIIDLKLGKLMHADIGQMLLYTGYADEHWRMEGENPPVGLILCDQNNTALAHYTLENLPNKILASEYRMILPSEDVLIEEINKAKRLIGK